AAAPIISHLSLHDALPILASIRTRATRTDTGWLLNGSKIWTTNAQHSHYMIALVRTSGEPQDRYKGLSQLIVDLSLPGVTVRPRSDEHTSELQSRENLVCR